jgi:hypothetical protein
LLLLILCAVSASAEGAWNFAVSGDSRNCGDVVMPAIAKKAAAKSAAFYWHLGDLRATYKIDEDIARRNDQLASPLSTEAYHAMEWTDFIEHEIKPFAMPFFVGIGNHELIPPKSREDFVSTFSQWLDAPVLKDQRLRDDPKSDASRTYYHWNKNGIDFIFLDNASAEQFDSAQLSWFEGVLARDEADAAIKTVVVGMHEALPQSISSNHSMDQSETGETTGLRVYADLLAAQNKFYKRVYVLASHSHFFMNGIFKTKYWREHGGVLPGWIVGTAGAVRYRLPPGSKFAKKAQTDVYGYLLGRAEPSGKIDFEFQPVAETDIPDIVAAQYEPGLVHWCFAENTDIPTLQ